MKRTYTRTTMIDNLENVKVRLYVHNATKWEATEDDEIMVEYTGLKSWSIIEGGEEAAEIEAETDEDGIDEMHEYLVLEFADGTTATFRNSHVEMFLR